MGALCTALARHGACLAAPGCAWGLDAAALARQSLVRATAVCAQAERARTGTQWQARAVGSPGGSWKKREKGAEEAGRARVPR